MADTFDDVDWLDKLIKAVNGCERAYVYSNQDLSPLVEFLAEFRAAAEVGGFPFRLNERVQLAETSEYWGEYVGYELYFAGAIKGDDDMDIWLSGPQVGLCDGWDVDELEKWTPETGDG